MSATSVLRSTASTRSTSLISMIRSLVVASTVGSSAVSTDSSAGASTARVPESGVSAPSGRGELAIITGSGPVVGVRLTYSSGSPSGCISATTSTATSRARSNACVKRSRPWMSCSICSRASSRRRASSLSTRSRYARASLTISRPCCLAIDNSDSASAPASARRRDASISASSRTLEASSLASWSSCAAACSALSRISLALSRAVVNTRTASSPSICVIVASSTVPPPASACAACSSRSRKRSRSLNLPNSAATMRRKSRTSAWS